MFPSICKAPEHGNAIFTASDSKIRQVNQSTLVVVPRSKKNWNFFRFLNYSFCYLKHKKEWQDVTPYCPMAITQDARLPP